MAEHCRTDLAVLSRPQKVRVLVATAEQSLPLQPPAPLPHERRCDLVHKHWQERKAKTDPLPPARSGPCCDSNAACPPQRHIAGEEKYVLIGHAIQKAENEVCCEECPDEHEQARRLHSPHPADGEQCEQHNRCGIIQCERLRGAERLPAGWKFCAAHSRPI